jgi:RNA polymerase sigma-70 factor (ECF subfamily)
MPETDPDLMSQFVQRLTEAQSALYGSIHTMMAGASEVADVLQDTNRVLWQKMAQYDTTRPFLPWALRVAHFEVLAHRKRQSRDRLVFDDSLLGEIADEYERQSAGAGGLQALELCLQKLPQAQRALVESRYMHGKAVHDIAMREGKAANAISALLYRIRQLLAECIVRTRAEEGRA